MPKRTHTPNLQPKLLTEPRTEYQPTPEELAEKERYRQRLAEYLKDPAFRQIEGFPIGEDEAILALSDPPYYTACPNPFLGEIIARWQQERQALRKELGLPVDSLLPSRGEGPGMRGEGYHREPFAADVSEGKNDPIYNAHSYHTKVPHKAIMRYILHYTDPGDIVFDGFCGTGMTGVAAQLCGDKKTVESLGYTVQKDGRVLDEKGQAISRLGARKAVLVDLSPAATFIAYNYNTPVDARAFEREAQRILAEVEQECGWMYETRHTPPSPTRGEGGWGGEGVKGKINYTVWSDVFLCPQCGGEMVFWDVAVDQTEGAVRDDWDCPHCSARLSKRPRKDSGAVRAERAFETHYDRALGQTVRMAKQVPVLINYSVGKKRYEKRPDTDDLALLAKIEQAEIPYPFPTDKIPKGDKTSDPFNLGITHVHHFYTRRNLWALAAIIGKLPISSPLHMTWFTSALIRTSKMYKFTLDRKMGNVMGTLYVPSINVENSPSKLLLSKTQDFSKIQTGRGRDAGISCQSSTSLLLETQMIDYIFIDPPFGANLMYSELNFLWEAWLDVCTNNQPEAVVNKTQRKGLPEYQALMEACYREFYRILKPGRWMTVEFHNSQNSVWNAIQEAILQVGFMIADVRTLDKQQGSFNQATSSGAVKQDLIISAYKPTTAFEQQFQGEAGSTQGAWAFIRQHLEQLPLPAVENGVVETLTERQAYLLYDRMVAFHLVRGLSVPLSSPEFYQGLEIGRAHV